LEVGNTPDNSNELVIAVIAAVGTDIRVVVSQIGARLGEYDYTPINLRLSDYLAEHGDIDFRDLPLDEKLWEAMTAGDNLRQEWDRSDALVLHAISDIVATREQAQASSGAEGAPQDHEDGPPNLDRHAFVIRSLKTPDELETLRAVYGPRLVVIAAFSPRDKRLEHLGNSIEDSRGSDQRESWSHQPEDLVDRDEKEQHSRGQDVSGTFHRADFFIRGWDRDVIETDLKRTFEILFGSPFRTPTRDEYCQFMAAGAALRSAEFGRQVGAAIATPDGSLISLGTNEVPKAHGGTSWDGDSDGNREFEVSAIDSNRKHFDSLGERLAAAVDSRLDQSISEIREEGQDVDADELEKLRAAAVASLPIILREAGLKELTEFGRAVHAEMDALLDASRRGIPVQGATLYTTTFPCHNCARHIIGAGIRRVVFVEPYMKSRAVDLHGDAVMFDELESGDDEDQQRVQVQAFVGVAPRRYLEMFDAAARERLGHVGRQDGQSRRQSLDKKTAVPIYTDSGLAQFRPELREYRAKELLALEHFDKHAVGD
jgi:cytidine deaminase